MEHFVANIQKFSIDDGPGIRTTVFFMGCPLSCIWCHNPECILLSQILYWNELTCAQCGSCIKACPKNALFLENGKVTINRDLCDKCGICTSTCRVGALSYYGKTYTLDEIHDMIIEDLPFYQSSGGGVTFSGGEPLLHIDYLIPLLERLKEEGISMIFDTCGQVPWESFRKAIPYASAFLYDIKGMDDAQHRENTGIGNTMIHENLRKLSHENVDIYIRMPLIIGANAEDKELEAAAEFISELENIVEVDLLPYHAYGSSKYQRFGIPQSPRELSTPTPDTMKHFQSIFEKKNLKAVIKNQ